MPQASQDHSHKHLIRSIVIGIILVTLFILVAMPTVATGDDAAKTLATLTGDHQKQQFLAGRRVEATNAQVADDIFALGRDLSFETVSAKHIIAAGMSVNLTGITAEDLVMAGGQMTLSGEVADDVVAAVCPVCPFGGRLHLTKTMQIGDDARLAGRDIAIDGRVGGDLYSASQDFRLSGEIIGNARVEARRIVLAPTARISGDLLYAGPNKPEVQDGAIVTGQIRQVETSMPFSEGVPKNWIWYAVLAVFGVVLAMVLLGAAMQVVVPGLLSNTAATVTSRPWSSVGRGFVLMILIPASVALLMATVVGVPIGLVTMAAFFVLLALAFAAISYCVGLYVRSLFGHTDTPSGLGSRVAWTAAGSLILMIVALVPFVGWAVWMLAIVAGLGALISQLGPRLRKTEPIATPASA